MKYRYDLHNLGREIEQSVRNAVKPEDLQHLQQGLDDIVSELSQMGREFTQSGGSGPARSHTAPPRRERLRERPREVPTPSGGNLPAVSGRSVDGIVLTVLGCVFAGLTSVLGVVFAATCLMGQLVFSTVFGGLLAVGAAGSTLLLTKGGSLRRRAKRYADYLRLFAGSKLYPLEQLAIVTERSKNFLARDLRRMIDKGKLPGAHLDAEKTCIILDAETYDQYLQAEQKSRELAKGRKKKSPEATPEPAAPADLSPADALIQEGEGYIQRIGIANRMIKNPEVSAKIDQLESTVSKIFSYVQEHPEKQGDLRRLMSYYLPTTLKLLDSYCKFEAHAVRGENVSTAMAEIEGALDTINLAFENLLDDLFEHEMYDITSDISALETMLAQEGLTAQELTPSDSKNTNAGG